MFTIEEKYRSVSNMPFITDNKIVFHFDEYPILFAGTNESKNKIIGSLMCEEDDTYILRHIHSVVSDELFLDFINKKIAYRDLIKQSGEIYILDIDVNGTPVNVYNVPFDVIPVDYLPLEGVLCPNPHRAAGKTFD